LELKITSDIREVKGNQYARVCLTIWWAWGSPPRLRSVRNVHVHACDGGEKSRMSLSCYWKMKMSVSVYETVPDYDRKNIFET
jgi:hypothetical protein